MLWNQAISSGRMASGLNQKAIYGTDDRKDPYLLDSSLAWAELEDGKKMVAIAAGNTANVWGLDEDHQVYRWNGRAWMEVDAVLHQISVGIDGSVVGLDEDGVPLQGFYEDEEWSFEEMDGELAYIHIHRLDELWGVDKEGKLQKWNGMDWKSQGGAYTSITTDVGGNVWGLDKEGGVWQYYGDQPVLLPGKMKQVVACDRVWGLDMADKLCYWDGMKWQAQRDVFTQISIDRSNYLWGINGAGKVMYQVQHAWGVMEGELEDIEIGADTRVWGIKKGTQELMQWHSQSWLPQGQKFVQLSTAHDGTTMAVNDQQELYQLEGNVWVKVEDKHHKSCANVSVGSKDEIWCVDGAGTAFKLEKDGFKEKGKDFSQLSVASDGTVWGITKGEELKEYKGDTWTASEGKWKYVAVGSALDVWALNDNKEVFRRVGSDWLQLPGKLETLTVSRDGEVWGINTEGNTVKLASHAVMENTASVACIVKKGSLEEMGNGTYKLRVMGYSDAVKSRKGRPLCADEPFFFQPTVSFSKQNFSTGQKTSYSASTGFLVGEDLLATAGHAFFDKKEKKLRDLSQYRVVFGFRMLNEASPIVIINDFDVYEIRELVGKSPEDDTEQDWAVVRLKRKVGGRKPLKMRTKGALEKDMPLYILGHPKGLPLKYGDNAVVISTDELKFHSDLDAFKGNSGSPVFNAHTHEVEGILVQGEADFFSMGGCMSSNQITSKNVKGEGCQSIKAIQSII